MALPADTRDAPVYRPGDFHRHPKTGAPFVAHLTETTKRTGTKAELIVQCADAGIAVPAKVTVAGLQALLGPRPKKVMYGRPSSLGRQIENMTNLQKWSERAVALGVFLDRALLDALVALAPEQWNLDDDAARDVLDQIAVAAKDTASAGLAAERGTHGHAITEDYDTERDWIERAREGEDLGLPIEVQTALVAAWERMLAEFDIEILAVEAACVDDAWRQAGTLDRIGRLRRDLTFIAATGELVTLPAGTIIVLDIKTGKLRLDTSGFVSYWHAYAVQVASYAQSVPYDADRDVRGEWGFDIDQRWAIIAHLDVLAALDGEAVCRLVLVDLEAGRQAGAMCVAAREWEARRDVFSLVTDDLAVSVAVQQTADAESRRATGTEATPAVPVVPSSDTESLGAVPEASGATPPDTPEAPGPTAPSADQPNVAGVGQPSPAPTPATLTTEDLATLAVTIGSWGDDVKHRLARLWPHGLATPRAVRDGTAAWSIDDLPALQAAFTDANAPWTVADHGTHPTETNRWANTDGGPLDPRALEVLLAECQHGDVQIVMNTWLAEGKVAGVYWNPRILNTVRSFEQARAARALAGMHDDTVPLVPLILATAGHVDPGHPIGAVIGRMTIGQARAVIAVVDSIEAQRLILQFSDSGAPLLVGDVAAALAAA